MKDKNKYKKASQLNLRTLVILSRTAQTVHRKEVTTIKKSGLTVSQFGVLEVLYHKGALRISTVTQKVLSTGGNMTVVINNLVKSGLIKRYRDPEDSRATVVELTEIGNKLMEEHFPAHIENIDDIFSVLTDKEKENLILLLKKLSGV